MNHHIIIGRMATEPELKTFNDGSEYCNFTVAVDRDYKDKDGNKPCDFFPCRVTKGGAALISKYFHKGDGIGLSGSMESHQYEKNGEKRTAWEFRVKGIEFLPAKKSGGNAEAPQFTEDTSGGDLPF